MLKQTELLKRARKNRNLTQREMALKLNVKTTQQLSNMERGAAPVPMKVMNRLIKLGLVSRKSAVMAYEEDLRSKMEVTLNGK